MHPGQHTPAPRSLFPTQQPEGFFQNWSHDDPSTQNSSLTSHHAQNRSGSPSLHLHSPRLPLGLCCLCWSHFAHLTSLQHLGHFLTEVFPDSVSLATLVLFSQHSLPPGAALSIDLLSRAGEGDSVRRLLYPLSHSPGVIPGGFLSECGEDRMNKLCANGVEQCLAQRNHYGSVCHSLYKSVISMKAELGAWCLASSGCLVESLTG